MLSEGCSASAKSAVMGYAYSEHAHSAPATSAPVHHARMVRHAGEALATFTGFEMLADGGSRLQQKAGPKAALAGSVSSRSRTARAASRI